MNTTNERNALMVLYKFVEAGEQECTVVASNIRNRALKILYKAYAQQRLKFKEEILAEIQRLGGRTRPRSNILGILHRGRIDIFTALTIGDERMENLLLKEILIGESASVRSYEKTLQANLPPETRKIVERQLEAVRRIVEEIRLLKGKDGKRLLMRMYDSRQAAEHVLRALKDAGVADEAIEIITWDHAMDVYQGRGTTVREAVMAGAVGGALWGLMAGLLAALGITQISRFESVEAPSAIMVLAILGLTAAGIFIGGMEGFFLGLGIRSDDSYRYQDILEHGDIVLRAVVDIPRASKAWQIMKQIVMDDTARELHT